MNEYVEIPTAEELLRSFVKYPPPDDEQFTVLQDALDQKTLTTVALLIGHPDIDIVKAAAAILQVLDEEPDPAKKIVLLTVTIMSSIISGQTIGHLSGHECERSRGVLTTADADDRHVMAALDRMFGVFPAIDVDKLHDRYAGPDGKKPDQKPRRKK